MRQSSLNSIASVVLGGLLSGPSPETDLSRQTFDREPTPNATSTFAPGSTSEYQQELSHRGFPSATLTRPSLTPESSISLSLAHQSGLTTSILDDTFRSSGHRLGGVLQDSTNPAFKPFNDTVTQELWSARIGLPIHEKLRAALPAERLSAALRVVESYLNTHSLLVSFTPQEPQQTPQQEPQQGPQVVPQQGPQQTPQQAPSPEEQARSETARVRSEVNRAVCEYWLEKDKDAPGGGNQDAEAERAAGRPQVPDRLDKNSYNGHGVGKAYPLPIPGARADGHYNCEYFADNFRTAFMAEFADKGGECWILHHSGHATAAWYYKGVFSIIEPQGGSPYFVRFPNLTPDNMPRRGDVGTVDGVTIYHRRHNNWLEIDEVDYTESGRRDR